MKTEPAIVSEIRSTKVVPETERAILNKLASFDEDEKTAVNARETLVGIRRNLKAVSAIR